MVVDNYWSSQYVVAVTPNTPLWRMADRMAGGNLLTKLTDYRDALGSWESVAMRLFADDGIEVSPQTLRTWARQLGLDAPEKASA